MWSVICTFTQQLLTAPKFCLILGRRLRKGKTSLEKMLMHQAAVCHSVSMDLLRRAQEKSYNSYKYVNGEKKNVCLQKVLDKSGIKIREGFRFQIPFSGRLSNL